MTQRTMNMSRSCEISECFASQLNTKAVLSLFLNTLQKYYQRTILGTLDMPVHLHRNQYCQLVETMMFTCMQKINFLR